MQETLELWISEICETQGLETPEEAGYTDPITWVEDTCEEQGLEVPDELIADYLERPDPVDEES